MSKDKSRKNAKKAPSIDSKKVVSKYQAEKKATPKEEAPVSKKK